MFKQADTIITERLQSNWVATPIDFDNVRYVPTKGTPFVRLQTMWAETSLVSVTGRARGIGYIDIDIFVPYNTGTSIISEMADNIAALYNRYREDGLECEVATTQRIGEREEWYQLKVTVPFKYDECYN